MHIKINHRIFFIKTLSLIIILLFPFFVSSQEKEIDSIQNDSIKKEKFLLDKVNRKAKGFIRINNKKKTILLYDNAELKYMNIELRAGIIEFDWENNIVSAGRIIDSLGNVTQTPIFKQGMDEVNPDSLRYNFDTKKALIWNSRSEQSDMNVFSEATKKENDSIYFIKDTLKEIEKKIKIKKIILSGWNSVNINTPRKNYILSEICYHLFKPKTIFIEKKKKNLKLTYLVTRYLKLDLKKINLLSLINPFIT